MLECQTRPDLILTDIMMPEVGIVRASLALAHTRRAGPLTPAARVQVSGMELIDQVSHRWHDIPVIGRCREPHPASRPARRGRRS